MSEYQAFLDTKRITVQQVGVEVDDDDIHRMLFPFQRDVTRWACRKGRCAVFLDTGLGKTFIQLEWARLIGENTLIIAPLSVARQTVREGAKIGLDVRYVRGQDQTTKDHRLWITNYEMAERFDFSTFGAVVLDESSILKAIAGKTRKKLTELCVDVPYRLCCTATPAPNDNVEIGNHAQFLGVCTMSEMLAMFFINANREHTFEYGGKMFRKKGSNKGGQEWRLKHHAEQSFFRWLASWAITMTKPSDLGYDDDGFILPPLETNTWFVQADYVPEDQLFFTHIKGVKHAAAIRRQTAPKRLEVLKDLINANDEQWIVWCGLNTESNMVAGAFPDAVEVKGGDDAEFKAQAFEDFQDGKHRLLVTKSRIGGYGMNFQNAHNMAFMGLSYSWEQFYQCIRREWRYRQESPVDVHIIMSDIEAGIYQEIKRKDAMAKRLRGRLIDQIRVYEKGELEMSTVEKEDYQEDIVRGDGWVAMLGDSCERMKELEDNSIDLAVFSPPFADLFTYTDSERDLGNCRNWDEFFDHYKFIIRESLRVTKPGRLNCVHTSDIPAMAQKDGYIGVRNFPGEVVAAYKREGWTFVGRAFVQKNPQAQAIRTKSKSLLFVQLRKDSTASRPALIDQVLLFKKPGDNAVPVLPVANGEMDNETWIEWAHGIWFGISESDTLQFYDARDFSGDEKHICPLQLGTIERCIKLYSNPGETVLTPFGGIGSEGYMAVKLGRKAVLIELKDSYFDVLVRNMQTVEIESRTEDLFSYAGVEVPA